MVFLFILGGILLIVGLLIFSQIRIEILQLQFSSQMKKKIDSNYMLIFKWKILNKIPILKVKITESKIKKWKLKEKVKDLETKMIQDAPKINKDFIEIIKGFKIKIPKLDLKIEIGTENAALTAILVPVISTFLSLVLRNKIENHQDQTFLMNPVYQNQNLLNISLSGIFEMKLNHIIVILYRLNKKEGVKKYERTSHRRSYDYSYE